MRSVHILNFSMGLTLHQHGHSHSNSTGENINVRAAFIHVIGDFLQSFGVLLAAVVIYYKVGLLTERHNSKMTIFSLHSNQYLFSA